MCSSMEIGDLLRRGSSSKINNPLLLVGVALLCCKGIMAWLGRVGLPRYGDCVCPPARAMVGSFAICS